MVLRRDAVLAGGAGIAAALLPACNSASDAHRSADQADAERAASASAPLSAQSTRPGGYDRAAIMRILDIQAPHKQVFENETLSTRTRYAPIFVKMQNSLNAFEFSLGMGRLAPLGVLTGTATLLALEDAMWSKYGIGAAYGFKDAAGQDARTNVFQKARSSLSLGDDPSDPNSIYHDFSGEAVVRRGAKFFVCHDALVGIASRIAAVNQADPKAVLGDIQSNLLNEHYLVPSGVAAIQLAQERGWRLYVT